jgi:GntR family transcriptional regulator / MocR family aminotransferase
MTSRFRGIYHLISVDRRATRPLYRQIYHSLRSRIINGELRPGELLPSTRGLARQLHVSRLPVLNAYSQLLAEGYFESRVGSGTYVATSLPESAKKQPGRSEFPLLSSRRAISQDVDRIPPYQPLISPLSLGPFQVGQPDLHQFPIRVWLRLVARYSRMMRVKGLQYGNPMGRPDLREAIASYLRTSRGVRCELDQVMIVSGSQQALDITTRVLVNSGDPVWIEEPGYWLVQRALQARGCRIIAVPVDANGLNVDAGLKLNKKARAIFLAPSHQYPLGVTMTASRRLQLLEWAEGAGAWIVEDDYDSEFRYGSNPIASLQGLDRHARVLYIGSVSKVMFPSLRLGYLVVPRDLVNRFAAMRQVMDICPADLPQAVTVDFIREGHFARHIRRMRPIYAQRREQLVETIKRELGHRATIIGDTAGMHLTLLIDDLRSDGKVAAAAAKQSLWLSPLSQSYVGRARRQGFVLGFGNTRADQIAPAVRQLKKLLEKLR